MLIQDTSIRLHITTEKRLKKKRIGSNFDDWKKILLFPWKKMEKEDKFHTEGS